jgi:hypothetical protein
VVGEKIVIEKQEERTETRSQRSAKRLGGGGADVKAA